MSHPRGSSRREGPLPWLVSAVAEPLFGTDRYDAWIPGGWWPGYLAMAGLLAAVIVCRRFDVVTRPQFWAEDGSIYFCDALVLGFRAVFRLYEGFPHLGQRLIAAFGSLFPLAAAPRVYTTAAIVIEALSVATFSLPRFRHLVRSDALRTLFCVACVSLPVGTEVFATPANVGWFLGLWLLFASLSTAPRRMRSLVGLTACGVAAIASTPLAVLLAPLWLLRSLDGGVRHDRREIIFGVILLVALGFVFLGTPRLGTQAPFVLSIPGHNTPVIVSFHWANLEVATARIVMTLVVPQARLNQLAISDPYPFHLGAVVVLGVLLGTAAVEGRRQLVQSLCGLSLMIGALGLLLLARPDWNLFMAAPDLQRHVLGGRYAVFPIACTMLCLVVVLDGIATRRLRTLATAAAYTIVMLAWWPTFAIAPLPDLDWPQWAARLQAKLDAGSREPLVIPTPPWWRIKIDAPSSSGPPRPGDRCAGSTYHDADAAAAGAP
jgi:hypothetical protein